MTASIDFKGRDQIIQSVRFVRKASIAANALQCVYLGTFLAPYSVEMVYCLPILWSVSCTTLMFNFIRNRHYVHSHCLCADGQTTKPPSPSADDADMVSVIMGKGEVVQTPRARPQSTSSMLPSNVPSAAQKMPRPLTILVDHAEPLAAILSNGTPTGAEGTPC